MRISGGLFASDAALVRRRVAGPRGDGDRPHGRAEAPSREGDPGQRGPQVPLHVVGQGLERADVEDPHGGARGRRARGRGRSNEPIDAPQEGGQRLAAARGGVEQDVAAAGDRRPALDLGRRRRREGVTEPGRDGRREPRERVLGGRGRGWAGGRSGSAGHGIASIRRRRQTDQAFYSRRPGGSWRRRRAWQPAVPPNSRAPVTAYLQCGDSCDGASRVVSVGYLLGRA